MLEVRVVPGAEVGYGNKGLVIEGSLLDAASELRAEAPGGINSLV